MSSQGDTHIKIFIYFLIRKGGRLGVCGLAKEDHGLSNSLSNLNKVVFSVFDEIVPFPAVRYALRRLSDFIEQYEVQVSNCSKYDLSILSVAEMPRGDIPSSTWTLGQKFCPGPTMPALPRATEPRTRDGIRIAYGFCIPCSTRRPRGTPYIMEGKTM